MPRKDRDGLYRQPGSPHWYGSYTDNHGIRRRRSTGTDNQAEAKIILSRWRTETHQQRVWGAEPTHTLHQLIIAYVDTHPDKRTLERDGYSVQHLYRLLGESRPLNTLCAADAHGYCLTRRQEGAQPGTINREIGFLSSAINWSRRALGWKIDNPAAAQRLPEPPGRNRWLTHDEASRLIEAAGRVPQAAHLGDFILLGLHTGMRSGEMLGLEWGRVDLQAGRILLGAQHQKSGRPGSIPLNRTARGAILNRARFRAARCPASPWVFCNQDGERIASVKKGFATAVKRAGIAPCTPHDLRRTCASWLVQAGTPIQEVARLLRHADIQTTLDVYAHLMPDQLQGTVAILERHNLVIGPEQIEEKTAATR
ncbi:MAG: site-specific integrase [Candidatus Competibacteraceae bacterium]